MITIGMPYYNDFDGAYFTLQALRLYHDMSDVELLVVDNEGSDRLEKWLKSWKAARYVKDTTVQGTAFAKNKVFEHAEGDFVLCIDCHVLLMPGVVKRLVEWAKETTSNDLYYGCLGYDNLTSFIPEMKDTWRGHMWGVWGDSCKEEDLPSDPMEIWGHGGGCFGSFKDAWLGFHKQFRGFGGEEGYLPEKYRRNDRKVWCLPWLKWIHRFNFPGGTGYRLQVEDRIRNYLIGFQELGLDPQPVLDHFGPAAQTMAEAMQTVVVKSFNGIGDLLYATPSFSTIKKSCPGVRLVVNTNYPQLLEGNPYVDEVGSAKEGVFLGYPDAIHRERPTKHHILSDWEIICNEYHLKTEQPAIKPEIYLDLPQREGGVIVQTISKGTFSGKKIWPHAEAFAAKYGFPTIPHFDDVRELVRCIAKAQLVVCMEGGVHHIAAAVGTPAIVILPAWMDESWVGYENQWYINSPCESSKDCYNPDPCKHQQECLAADPEYVYQEVLKVIQQPIRLFPSKKKLNLGSGEMLLKDFVNFDAQAFKRGGLVTDAFGIIENLTAIYDENTFDEVLSAHVIEHMLEPDSIKMLKDIHHVLKPGGKAVVEGPDFLGAQKVAGDDVRQAMRWIMSHTTHPKKWGDHWYHKSAWTKDTLAEEMEKLGFDVVHVGIGRTHGMGERDFRVEGIKK